MIAATSIFFISIRALLHCRQRLPLSWQITPRVLTEALASGRSSSR
jgi:predicted 3-demethylubiquinone-9 3-methyltransferase (glyoxalase superfamily)